MGFTAVAKHRSRDVTLYRQGDVNFIVNAEPGSLRPALRRAARPLRLAMAFRVADAGHAFERAVSLGAEPVETRVGPMELNIPAIEGIGGSLLYFVDRYGDMGSIYDVDFVWTGEQEPRPHGAGLYYIDHLTHNVRRGNMGVWAGFYQRIFNFRQIRYFDIEGKLHRPVLQGADQPGRQDPHSDQRERRREEPDRRIPAGLQGRGHPARRLRLPRHL